MTIALQRFTTEYIPEQDRISLTGAPEQGAPQVVWLTQRLLRRLLPVLLGWLEQGAAAGQAAAAPAPAPAPAVAQAMQEFAQQAAHAAWQPLPPVEAVQASQSWLAGSVDVTQGDSVVQLVFHDGDGHAASLLMEALPLRQWLAVLQARGRDAEWALAWPAWLDGAVPVAAENALMLH